MVAATPSPPPIVSYADALHGWRAAGPGIEATNDGGVHWKVVFRWRAGDGADDATTVLRTSASAGIITFLGEKSFVTSDGGAHWYVVAARPFEQPAGDQLVGHGPLLFGSRGTAIYEALQWPLEQLRCRGRWYHAVESPIGDFGPQPRNICLGGPGATIHTRIVLTAPPDPATGYTQYLEVRELTADGLVYDVIGPDEHTVVDSGTMYVGRPTWSWADRNHGWRAAPAGLLATDDGGHHWRLILRTENTSGAGIDDVIRTSPTSGLVWTAGRLLVTNDAGRHWYEVSGGPSWPAFGRGSLLFGTGGQTIDKAVQWPLPRLFCHGRWVHSAEYFSSIVDGPKPRSICLQQRGGPVLRMQSIWRLPADGADWEIFGRSLSHGELDADVIDVGTDTGAFVGTVVYRDGVVMFSPR